MDITNEMTTEEQKNLASLCEPEQTKKKRQYQLEGFTAAELVNMELPPVKYIIDDLLPEGLTLIAGRPKIGKSWLMMGLSVAVAAGGYFLDSIQVKPSRVLYLALEDNARRLSSRLKMVLRGKQAPDNLHLFTEWPRVDQNGAVLMEKFLEKYPDTKLIIIDTLQKIKAKPKRSNATLYQEDYTSVEPLKAIADKYSIGVIIVHHTRKSGSDDAYETISGTTGLTGGTDAMMVLSRDRARCDGVLYITGRDIADKELALRWNDDTTSWSLLGGAAEYRMSQERQVIVEVLRQSSEPMTSKEIAGALGKNHNTIRYNLSNMYKDGQIQKATTGRYYINTTTTSYTTNKQIQQVQQIQQRNMFDVVGGTGTSDTTASSTIEIDSCKDSCCSVVDVVADDNIPDWVKEAEKLDG